MGDFLVLIEDLRSRREEKIMFVTDAADGLKEVLEIISLSESGELGNITESGVDDGFNPSRFEPSEESLGRFFSEADRVQDHKKRARRPFLDITSYR